MLKKLVNEKNYESVCESFIQLFQVCNTRLIMVNQQTVTPPFNSALPFGQFPPFKQKFQPTPLRVSARKFLAPP